MLCVFLPNCLSVCLKLERPLFTSNFGSTVSRGALSALADRQRGRQRIGTWKASLYASPMSKFNNKFSFYMLMFCGVGTVFNLTLLNFGKWGA